MSHAESLIAHLESEAPGTRKMLEIAPSEKFDWKPHEKSMTLGMLASHIAEAPTWIPALLEDEMDFASMDDYKPFLAGDHAELMSAFDANMKQGIDFIRDKDDDFLNRTWTMKKGEMVCMQQPKHAVIRMIAIHHMIHHRGQLSVYLRLLDQPLPPIYGPTADNPEGF